MLRLWDDPITEIQHVSRVAHRVKRAIERELQPQHTVSMSIRTVEPVRPQSKPDLTTDDALRWVNGYMGFFVGFLACLVVSWLAWG